MEPTITIAGLVGMLALVKSAVDFLRRLANLPADKAAVLHQALAYVGGTAVVFLYGASQFGDFAVPGTKLLLSDMNGWTKLIVGLSVASLAGLVTDFIKARDASDSAKVPPIVKP